MTVAAVYDAITITRRAVEAALGPLILAQQGGTPPTRLYWQRQSMNVYPCVIHQNQDRGGLNASFLSFGSWEGEWVVQAFATDQETADTWLAAVRGGMDSLSLPAGWTAISIQAVYDHPVVVPPQENIWPAGALWRVRLTRF
jgi:hypothetical protein